LDKERGTTIPLWLSSTIYWLGATLVSQAFSKSEKEKESLRKATEKLEL
jgi:hypothetical protein